VPKVWVLDTETKGTGANMVPLERVLRKGGPESVPGFALPPLRPPPPIQPDQRTPLEFKVMDILTRRVLGEGLDAREAVEVLENVRSIVDVNVYVWEPHSERWRMLTFGETQMLWEYRSRVNVTGRAQSATAAE
jgi:hypothetical protein